MNYPNPWLHKSGYYYFTYSEKSGKRKNKSTKTKTKIDARIFIKQFMDNLAFSHESLREYIRPFYVPGQCPIMQIRQVGLEHASHQHGIIENHILNDKIVDIRMNDIKRGDVIDFCTRKLIKSGPKHAQKIYQTLRAIMTMTEFRGDIKVNPCRGIGKDFFYRHLKDEIKEIDIFTPVEIEMIFSREYSFFKKEVSRIAYLIANETGLRRSEILALTWGCIDFKQRIINGTRAWKSWSEKTIGPPRWGKTRIVPLTKKLCSELENYKENVITCKPDSLVVCWENGLPYSPKSWDNWFDLIVE